MARFWVEFSRTSAFAPCQPPPVCFTTQEPIASAAEQHAALRREYDSWEGNVHLKKRSRPTSATESLVGQDGTSFIAGCIAAIDNHTEWRVFRSRGSGLSFVFSQVVNEENFAFYLVPRIQQASPELLSCHSQQFAETDSIGSPSVLASVGAIPVSSPGSCGPMCLGMLALPFQTVRVLFIRSGRTVAQRY